MSGRLSRRRLLTLTAASAAAFAVSAEATNAGTRPLVPYGVGQGSLQVRRNAKLLTHSERSRLVNAIRETKQMPSRYDPTVNVYDYWVQLHYNAYYDPAMPAHMAAAFPPWHRWMLLLFEHELQEIDPDITIPYWDWTVDNQPDSYLWENDFMGGDGDPADNWIVKTGPFRQGEWSLMFIDPESYDQDGNIFDLQRHFAAKPSADVPTTTLPTLADVEAALSIPVYDVEPWDDTSDPA
jgi:tyrosinase